jgi:uncharacterized Fe-S center protein
VIEKKCTACGCCVAICPAKAILLKEGEAFIEQKVCVGCGECLCVCKFDAIYIHWHEDPQVFCRRMVEVVHTILSEFKNKFFITFAFDITKECDCISTKDEKMIAKNLGILASTDIVSLDKATMDLAKQHRVSDFLVDTQEIYEGMLAYAAQNGLGNPQYHLINL